MVQDSSLFQFLLRMGDDSLICGQRLSEWTSNAHLLEEDIALANIALDHFGQADAWLKYAAEVEGKGRSEDDLAFLRVEREYTNLLIVELPNGNFADTIARQFYYDIYHVLWLNELTKSSNERIAGIAAKGLKEAQYHARHSTQWVLRLGDGTSESREKMQTAINDKWAFVNEFWEVDNVMQDVISDHICPDPRSIEGAWLERVKEVLAEATLTLPDYEPFQTGGRRGIHTENLGHMLGEMQFLQRAYPNSNW